MRKRKGYGLSWSSADSRFLQANSGSLDLQRYANFLCSASDTGYVVAKLETKRNGGDGRGKENSELVWIVA